VRVSRTSFLDGELVSSVMGLTISGDKDILTTLVEPHIWTLESTTLSSLLRLLIWCILPTAGKKPRLLEFLKVFSFFRFLKGFIGFFEGRK